MSALTDRFRSKYSKRRHGKVHAVPPGGCDIHELTRRMDLLTEIAFQAVWFAPREDRDAIRAQIAEVLR